MKSQGATVAFGTRFAVCMSRQKTDLTNTEVRLLQILQGEPGRVYSRAELAALAMPDTIVGERTIDVHVFWLRKKLGAAGKNLEAVRNQGYRWKKE